MQWSSYAKSWPLTSTQHNPPHALLLFTTVPITSYKNPFSFPSPQVPLPDLFKPVWEYTPRDVNDKLSSLWARGVVALLLSGCCWALLVMGPDAKTVKTSVQDAQDSVLRYFVSAWVDQAEVVLCKPC